MPRPRTILLGTLLLFSLLFLSRVSAQSPPDPDTPTITFNDFDEKPLPKWIPEWEGNSLTLSPGIHFEEFPGEWQLVAVCSHEKADELPSRDFGEVPEPEVFIPIHYSVQGRFFSSTVLLHHKRFPIQVEILATPLGFQGTENWGSDLGVQEVYGDTSTFGDGSPVFFCEFEINRTAQYGWASRREEMDFLFLSRLIIDPEADLDREAILGEFENLLRQVSLKRSKLTPIEKTLIPSPNTMMNLGKIQNGEYSLEEYCEGFYYPDRSEIFGFPPGLKLGKSESIYLAKGFWEKFQMEYDISTPPRLIKSALNGIPLIAALRSYKDDNYLTLFYREDEEWKRSETYFDFAMGAATRLELLQLDGLEKQFLCLNVDSGSVVLGQHPADSTQILVKTVYQNKGKYPFVLIGAEADKKCVEIKGPSLVYSAYYSNYEDWLQEREQDIPTNARLHFTSTLQAKKLESGEILFFQTGFSSGYLVHKWAMILRDGKWQEANLEVELGKNWQKEANIAQAKKASAIEGPFCNPKSDLLRLGN